jgi:putative ABC transport system substrate-binding protein
MRRQEFITGLGGAAVWPLAAWAQQRALPVVGFVAPGGEAANVGLDVAAFRQGLGETGYLEGQNVTVEYRSYTAGGDVLTELVRRRVA